MPRRSHATILMGRYGRVEARGCRACAERTRSHMTGTIRVDGGTSGSTLAIASPQNPPRQPGREMVTHPVACQSAVVPLRRHSLLCNANGRRAPVSKSAA